MATIKELRNILKSIPEDTPYCYTPLSGFGKMEDGKYGYKIKTCPYFKFITSLEGKCKLYKIDVEDQVKSCDLRIPNLKLTIKNELK